MLLQIITLIALSMILTIFSFLCYKWIKEINCRIDELEARPRDINVNLDRTNVQDVSIINNLARKQQNEERPTVYTAF